VQAPLDVDPFTTHGVYSGCDIKPWKIVFSKTELLSPA